LASVLDVAVAGSEEVLSVGIATQKFSEGN